MDESIMEYEWHQNVSYVDLKIPLINNCMYIVYRPINNTQTIVHKHKLSVAAVKRIVFNKFLFTKIVTSHGIISEL